MYLNAFWQIMSASAEMLVISLAPKNSKVETPTWPCFMEGAWTTWRRLKHEALN